jgi:penicillin-binding protein A
VIPNKPSGKVDLLLYAIIMAFLAMAGGLVYWGVLRGPVVLGRDDNPRRVEAGLRIQRGSIFDRQGTLLAESVGAPGPVTRQYPLADIGPAVGYYSFRYGVAGVEESYDGYLRGESDDFWGEALRQWLHKPQVGGDLRLTLDAELQLRADALLGEQAGAVLLLKLPDDEAGGVSDILVMASNPNYDPNLLREQFEALAADTSAPLLNRVTQGQYQPGLVAQPFLLAQALERGFITLTEPVEQANRTVYINGAATTCAAPPPEDATWADALALRCPGPMLDLAEQMGLADMTAALSAFGLTEPPEIALATSKGLAEPLRDARLTAIGQDNLVVTPLQVGLAWAALADNGRFPTLQLVSATQDPDGNWQMVEMVRGEETAVRPPIAQQILQTLPEWNGIREFSALALSGPEGGANSWYLGLYPAENPAYAVVVALEGATDLAQAEAIGREVLGEIGR